MDVCLICFEEREREREREREVNVARDWLSGVLSAVVAQLVVVSQNKVPLSPHLPLLYQPTWVHSNTERERERERDCDGCWVQHLVYWVVWGHMCIIIIYTFSSGIL